MKNTCLRCGHEWDSRTPDKPKCCPACKSYRWDMPRQDKDAFTPARKMEDSER